MAIVLGGNKGIVIVGNGCAAAECIRALRECGYHEKIVLLRDGKWSVANPMLTTYYVSGKIGFANLFPYGAGDEFYREYGVDVYTESAVTKLDAGEKVVATKSGLEVEYDECLIATGASPVLPPVEGLDSDRIFTVRTVEDSLRLKEVMQKKPRRALVVGASMVGIKLVELFHRAGGQVVLADLAAHVFPLAAHRDCARAIEKRLTEAGVKLRLGAALEKVEDASPGVRAYFKDGLSPEEADILVMSTGVRANTGFIDRRQVAADQGILVDEGMRTSVPGLYAAGDVAQGKNLLTGGAQIIGLWANARYQGRTAGRNMAGGHDVYPGNIPHNIARFMGMDFVSIGDCHDHDRTEKRCEGDRVIQLFWKDGLLAGANFLNCPTESGVVKGVLMKTLSQKKFSKAVCSDFIWNMCW